MRDVTSTRVAALAREASIEISPAESHELVRSKPYLKPGAIVTITWLPKDTYDARVAAAKAVRDAGFEPVPHIAARRVASEADLKNFLDRLKKEAAIRSLFVIGGDVQNPLGPYGSALDIIRSAPVAAAGVTAIGIADYPEPHPGIPFDEMEKAYRDKLDHLKGASIESFAMTQFSFDAEEMAAFLRRRRASGDRTLIRLGVAGPAKLGALLKFAARCGVTTSARAFFKNTDSMLKVLTETSPMPIIEALAEMPDFEELQPFGLHFFAFGGFVRTTAWIAETASQQAGASAAG
jgi:methylenetetrahydrofolate reductase (NADPH)